MKGKISVSPDGGTLSTGLTQSQSEAAIRRRAEELGHRIVSRTRRKDGTIRLTICLK